MQSSFDLVKDRQASLSAKWNKDAIKSICGSPDAKPFWVADMDFPVADTIAKKAQQLTEHAIFGYPFAPTQQELFCRWAKVWHHMEIQPEQVVTSQGVLNSIAVLLDMMTEVTDSVIVPFPAYQPFVAMVEQLQRPLIPWALNYDDKKHTFSLDWNTFESYCEKASVLIFCNPHNPSGLAFSEQELEKLCTIAKKYGVTIISDEIHADLSYIPHKSLLEFGAKTGAETVVCMAPSKTFNIAGEHYSVTLFNNLDLKKAYVKRLEQLFLTHTSTFATTLALAAYSEGETWLAGLVSYLQGNLSLVQETLQKRIPEIVLIKPEASFIAFLDCSALVPLIEKDQAAHPELYDPQQSPSGGLLSRFFGQRAKLAFNDGTWFGGDAYRGFVRINYGTQRSTIAEALQSMEDAVRYLHENY